MKLCVLSLIVGLAAFGLADPIIDATVAPTTSNLIAITPRIVGGAEARPNSIPYQAFIDTEFNSYFSWCGASIISTNYILTARHCVYK
jgi:secreted trypsin-like serine protease